MNLRVLGLVALGTVVVLCVGCESESSSIGRLKAGDLDVKGVKWLAQRGSLDATTALFEASLTDPIVANVIANLPQDEAHCKTLISSGSVAQRKGAILHASLHFEGLKDAASKAIGEASELEGLTTILKLGFGNTDKLIQVKKVSGESATIEVRNPTEVPLQLSSGIMSCDGSDQPAMVNLDLVSVDPGTTSELTVECVGAAPRPGCDIVFPVLAGSYTVTLLAKVK